MKSWRDNPNISAYLDGQATDDVRQEVEAAAAEDPALQQFLQGWPQVKGAFAALPRYQLPDNFAERVLAAISAEEADKAELLDSGVAHPATASAPRLTAGSAASSKDPAQSTSPSANGSAGHVQFNSVSTAAPPRSWHASAWLAIAAAASLMALMLLPPGTFSAGDSSTADLAQTWEPLDESRSQPEEGENAFEDFAGSSAVQLAEKVGEKFKTEAERPMEQALADLEVQDRHQQFRSFSQTLTQPQDVPEDTYFAENQKDIYLGMLYRLQEQLVEFEQQPASPGYLAVTPPSAGVDVLVCDVMVPAEVSDKELTEAFEQTLTLEREVALTRYKSQVAARLQDSLADADDGQEDIRRDEGLSFHVNDARKDANADKFGKGGLDTESKSDGQGGFERAELANIAGLTIQTQEAYYVESTREQIDAAIENLSIKASSEVHADNLPPTSDAYPSWALLSQVYRQENQPASGRSDAIEEFGRSPVTNSAQGGAAGFGGGGGGLGDAKNNANHGETRIPAEGLAADFGNASESASGDANRDRSIDGMMSQRGLAIRLPSHLYSDGLPSGLGFELAQQPTPESTNIEDRVEKSAGTSERSGGNRPRGGAGQGDAGQQGAKQNDDDLHRVSGGRQRGRRADQQQPQGPEGDQRSELGLPEGGESLVRRAIVVLRIHRQVAPPVEADAATEVPPPADDNQSGGGQ